MMRSSTPTRSPSVSRPMPAQEGGWEWIFTESLQSDKRERQKRARKQVNTHLARPTIQAVYPPLSVHRMRLHVRTQAKCRRAFCSIQLLWIILIVTAISCKLVIGAIHGLRQTTASTANSQATDTQLQVLCLGDSITEQGGDAASGGWTALLQSKYFNSIHVNNFGRAGYNTANCIELVLPPVVADLSTGKLPSPGLITLWFGANDAALATGIDAHEHIELDQYRTNLAFILSTLRGAAPFATIVLVTPPVVDDAKRRTVQQIQTRGNAPDRTNEQAAKYAQVCHEIVGQTDDPNVVLLDLYGILMAKYPQAKDRAALFLDGLHFSQLGNRIVFQEIQRCVEKMLPEVF